MKYCSFCSPRQLALSILVTAVVFGAFALRVEAAGPLKQRTTSSATGMGPATVVVAESLEKVFVANQFDVSESVSVSSVKTRKKIAAINLGKDFCGSGIAYNEVTLELFVADKCGGKIWVIDAVTNAVTGPPISIAGAPVAVAVDSGLGLVWVVDSLGGTVNAIDTLTKTVRYSKKVGKSPYFLAIDPVGKKVFVSNSDSNDVTVLDEMDIAAPVSIPVGKGPNGVSIDPIRRKVWVSNTLDQTVTILDSRSNAVEKTFSVGTGPFGVAINHSVGEVYVTNLWGGDVTVLDLVTHMELQTVTINSSKSGVFGVGVDTKANTAFISDQSTKTLVAVEVVLNPAITSAAPVAGQTGVPYTFTVTADGRPAPEFSIVGTLPKGITFDRVTGEFSGKPVEAGSFALFITASNGFGIDAVVGYALQVRPGIRSCGFFGCK